MIRLNYAPVPNQLDNETVRILTEEFLDNGKSVWKQDYITDALRSSSFSKCAYCETNIHEESKYMEVEHFRCKKDFPHLVVNWNNLLPSCKRCNGYKGEHNVETDGEIINPYLTTPSEHLYFQNYRLKWRDRLGRLTIETTHLNDSDRLTIVRAGLGEALSDSLEKIRELVEDFIEGPQTNRRRNRITRGMEALLKQAQPESEYSALAATVLLEDENYDWVARWLQNSNLWLPLVELHENAERIRLSR